MMSRMAAADETPRAYLPLPKDRVSRRHIAVLGGGLMGTATAYAAARLGGADVVVDLYEAAQIGHEGGASTDSVRLFRHAYGDLSHYTRWAAETFPLWRDLERTSARTLYVQTGSVWAVHADNDVAVPSAMARVFVSEDPRAFIEASHKALTALGLPNEILDGPDYQRRFPQFASTGVVAAFLDVNSGLVSAREAVLALGEMSQRFGVTVHEAKSTVEVAPGSGGCGVRFSDGTSIEADVVVLAINGWLSDVLPTIPLVVTEQVQHYVVPNPSAAPGFEPGRMPFCSWASTGIWVFPSRHGAVKVGDNYPSRTLRHPSERQIPEPSYRQRVLDLAIEQMPDLRDATLVQERVCFYDYSPDGDFILDQWDEHARLIVACGFSGHGFKFGPLVGQRLAEFALSGRRPADLAPFGLARLPGSRDWHSGPRGCLHRSETRPRGS
jgi:glycine/D-amino acid oxidase-like deaminating enzyme